MNKYLWIGMIIYFLFVYAYCWLIRKWDRVYWNQLNGRWMRCYYMAVVFLLMQLPCVSLHQMFLLWQMGIIFILAYMDFKTLYVYQNLIWLLTFLSLLTVFHKNKDIWICFCLCLVFIYMFKIKVYSLADAVVLCNCVIMRSTASSNILVDMLFFLLFMEGVFLCQGIVMKIRDKKTWQEALRQKMPLLPAVALVLYLYLL